jgi:hypothetical protein
VKAIQSRKATSEAEQFADWFHQDFGVLDDGNDAVASYIERLTPSQRTTLKRKLEALLQENPGKDQKGLRNAWLRLGARWSPRRKDLRAFIEGWISALH